MLNTIRKEATRLVAETEFYIGTEPEYREIYVQTLENKAINLAEQREERIKKIGDRALGGLCVAGLAIASSAVAIALVDAMSTMH